MTTDSQPRYLRIPNWEKYQSRLKNGKVGREWFRVNANRSDDPKIAGLKFFERGLLDAIYEYTARTGHWLKNDVTIIALATHALGTDRPHLVHALGTLIARELLVLCNQQNFGEFHPQDKTIQYNTYISPKPPSKANVKTTKKSPPECPSGYTPEFEKLWSAYPRANGKYAAFKAFLKINPRNGDLEKIIRAVEMNKQLPQWRENLAKGAVEFIPYLSTYLNQRRFEDFDEQNAP